jgi:hypothetical protein
MRVIPDVGYNADPESGVAVYNSSPMGDITGWMPGGVGGTSAGAPQWAALIALANGARKNLASPKSSIGSSANANIYQIAQSDYAATFNDIITGGPLLQPAGTGFDLSTGWGTPKATALIGDLTSKTVAYLATTTSYTARMILSSSAANTNPNSQTTIFTVPMGGTGLATGGSRISLSFVAVPNPFDTTGVVADIAATDLYSTVPLQNPAAGSYRVYGSGSVNFRAYEAFDGLGNAPVVPTGGPLKFEGWITVDANGNESIKCDFWAVDGNGDPWPTSPFKLAQLGQQLGGDFVSFTGSFNS